MTAPTKDAEARIPTASITTTSARTIAAPIGEAEARIPTAPKDLTTANVLTAPSAVTKAIPPTAPSQWGDLAELRRCGENLVDAIKVRAAMHNRARFREHAPAEESSLARSVQAAEEFEAEMRDLLMRVYADVVPEVVRTWAASVPGLATGELFPRIIAATGNPRVAVPLLPREKGSKVAQVPAGEPYLRTPRQFFQYCGIGEPTRIPRQHILGHSPTREDKLAAGKRNVVLPLLYTFASGLVRSASVVTKPGSKFEGRPRSPAAANSRYFQEYLYRKENATRKVHERQCQNKAIPPKKPNGCGTVAHPEWGAPGSPWRAGHHQAYALMKLQRMFLMDLFLVSPE